MAGVLIACQLAFVVCSLKADYFMNTGPLGTARNKGAAALLSDGKVVICGGYNLNAGAYLQSAERYDPSTGSWSPLNPMGTARWEHTATTLGNGKVLVAGGDGISGTLSSAELYDPATGNWTATTPPMPSARHNHTATLLLNGKVLVAGGQLGDFPTANTALYDPASGWSAATSIPTPRYGHTATLLPNGKVLVAGGFNSGYLNSALLFDPNNNSWTPTAFPMTGARYRHSAVLLANGKVLVTGGWNGNVYLSTAEVFDPANGTWTATTGPMGQARFEHTTTLLADGKVLVATGFGPGGPNGYQHLTSAELYDATARTFAATAPLKEGREGHTATALPDARVLIAGGYNNTSGLLTGTELYIPTISTWTASGTLGTGRNKGAGGLLANGKVLICGGYNLNGGGYLYSAELYDPATALWTPINPMGTARWEHTATVLQSGLVLVAGGDGIGGTLSSAELYNPANGNWTATTPSMPSARHNHTATLLRNGKVLVAGGQLGDFATANTALYDPASGWSATTPIPTPRFGHTATLLPNGKVLVAGGWNGSYLSSALLFDPNNNTWTPTAFPMTGTRYRHAATLLANGKVLVTGGWNGNVYLATAELYNPATDSWTATTQPMIYARYEHTTTLLPDGKVLIAAGYGPSGPNGYLSSAELYDPAADKFVGTGGLKAGRQGHIATGLANGKVLVAAGYDNSGFTTGSELYGPLLVDPKSSGGKTFSTVTYASTGTQRIPRYQNPTTGYAIDRRPDISPFWNSIDVATWGFDATSVPINGILKVPAGNGPFPLALFVHGNHTPTQYSDEGYVYLCEVLASWGILAATIDANFLNWNSCCGENGARAILHLEHVRQFEIWNGTPGHALYGKVDFNNIMIVGHSRGGEGVAHASYFNTYPGSNPAPLDGSEGLGPYGFNLKAVAAIAPTDGQYTPPDGVDPVRDNYFVIHGSRDGDVSPFDGYKTYDRAHPITVPLQDAEGFKALAWSVGANHNYFNSTWPNEGFGTPTLTRPEQENVAKVYLGALAQGTLLGRAGYLEFLKNHDLGKLWLPAGANFTSQYQEAHRIFIDHYEEDFNTSTLSSSLAGANTFSAGSFVEMFLDMGYSSDFYQETHAGKLYWNSPAHYYQAALNSPGLNGGGYAYLALRIGQSAESGNTPGNDQNLRIIIQDTSGGSTFFTAAAFSRLLYPDTGPMYGGTVRKMVMQTIRIPLSLIRERVNVNNISTVKFSFDQVNTGLVYFDEIQVSN